MFRTVVWSVTAIALAMVPWLLNLAVS